MTMNEKLELRVCLETANACMAFNLRRADRVVMQVYDEAFRPLGLRGTQFGVLMAARALEPVTMSELAARLSMDRTTLTRNLRPLTKQRWLMVETGEDRRERRLSLTPQGHKLLLKAQSAWRGAQARIAGAFGTEKMKTLVGQLAALTRTLQE